MPLKLSWGNRQADARNVRRTGIDTMGLQHPEYGCCLAPDLLDLVVLSFVGGENVDDHSSIVHKNPAGVVGAFYVQWRDVVLSLEPFLYVLGYGLNLALGAAAANHEVVSNQGEPPEIQKNNVRCFLVRDDIDHFVGQFGRIQVFNLPAYVNSLLVL